MVWEIEPAAIANYHIQEPDPEVTKILVTHCPSQRAVISITKLTTGEAKLSTCLIGNENTSLTLCFNRILNMNMLVFKFLLEIALLFV